MPRVAVNSNLARRLDVLFFGAFVIVVFGHELPVAAGWALLNGSGASWVQSGGLFVSIRPGPHAGVRRTSAVVLAIAAVFPPVGSEVDPEKLPHETQSIGPKAATPEMKQAAPPALFEVVGSGPFEVWVRGRRRTVLQVLARQSAHAGHARRWSRRCSPASRSRLCACRPLQRHDSSSCRRRTADLEATICSCTYSTVSARVAPREDLGDPDPMMVSLGGRRAERERRDRRAYQECPAPPHGFRLTRRCPNWKLRAPAARRLRGPRRASNKSGAPRAARHGSSRPP